MAVDAWVITVWTLMCFLLVYFLKNVSAVSATDTQNETGDFEEIPECIPKPVTVVDAYLALKDSSIPGPRLLTLQKLLKIGKGAEGIIQGDCFDNSECRLIKTIQKWISGQVDASWDELATAAEMMDEPNVALKIRSEYLCVKESTRNEASHHRVNRNVDTNAADTQEPTDYFQTEWNFSNEDHYHDHDNVKTTETTVSKVLEKEEVKQDSQSVKNLKQYSDTVNSEEAPMTLTELVEIWKRNDETYIEMVIDLIMLVKSYNAAMVTMILVTVILSIAVDKIIRWFIFSYNNFIIAVNGGHQHHNNPQIYF